MTAKDNEKLIEQLSSLTKEELMQKVIDLQSKKDSLGLVWEEEKFSPEIEFADMISNSLIPKITHQELLSKKNSNKAPSVLIEGDNFHALKFLVKKYKQSVNFIYLDPPYNTGKNDFRYKDNIVKKDDTFRHSKWLSFMKPRLVMAKELLAPDGVIFISINDAEFAHLKLLADSIFSEEAFITSFIWKSGEGGSNDSGRNISVTHEYILCYGAKDFKFNLAEKDVSKFMEAIPYENLAYQGPTPREGQFQLINLNKQKDYRVTIRLKDGTVLADYPSMAPQKSIDAWQELGEIVVNAKKVVYYKSFLEDEKQGKNYKSVLEDLGTAKGAGSKLGKILGFPVAKMYPKPVELINHLLVIASKKDSLILDFFAGSGTTGHAVWEQNQVDQGERKFILVTNNEIQEKIAKDLKAKGLSESDEEFQAKGLCREITQPRLIATIPETESLAYYKIDLVSKEESLEEEELPDFSK